jgi:hypothetical protein
MELKDWGSALVIPCSFNSITLVLVFLLPLLLLLLDLAYQKQISVDFGYPTSVNLTWRVVLNEPFHLVSVWLLIREFL